MPSHSETSPDVLDYEAVEYATNKKTKRGSYQTLSMTERYDIGKYAIENGTASTLRKFKNKFPTLKESAVRSICQKHQEELRKSI